MGIAGVWAPSAGDIQQRLRGMLRPGDGAHLHLLTPAVAFALEQAACLHAAASSPAVVFSGVLHNRLELASTLGLQRHGDSDPASVLAAAHERWGLDFVRELDGEFAFVLWDHRTPRLVLGRDAMGRGALHYARAGSALVFATEPQSLFRWPGISPAIDEEHLANNLTLRFESGRTMLQGVRYPAHGCIVIAEQGKADREVRYWFPEQAPQLTLRDPREYADALRAAMDRAVTVRLPADGVVVSELSSGYDSSAVTALAARALARSNRQLIAITSVPSHDVNAGAVIPNGYADEWTPASRVAAMYSNIEHVAVRTDSARWIESLDVMTGIMGGPPLFIRNMPWMYAARRYAQQRGASLMLTGQNGNLAGSYDGGFALFDAFRRGHLLRWLRTAREWRGTGTSWGSLLQRTWLPAPAARALVRRLLGRRGGHDFTQHSLVRPEFLRSVGVEVPPLSVFGLPVEGDRRSGASRRLSIMRIIDFGFQYAEEQRLFHYRRSDPTADRRLVELCLSIPDSAFCFGGKRRALYRDAMRDVLPPEILNEYRLGLQASDFLENFAAGMPEWRAEMDRLESCSTVGKYLDLTRMRRLLDTFHQRVAADRADADLTYNYTFGGALTLARYIRRMEEGALFY